MPTPTLSPSLTTVGLAGNLLCHRSGQHPDGLHRARQFQIAPNGSHAYCTSGRLCNPRWGLSYVIATIGPSWEMGTEKENILTEERHFLPAINDWVSMPSNG